MQFLIHGRHAPKKAFLRSVLTPKSSQNHPERGPGAAPGGPGGGPAGPGGGPGGPGGGPGGPCIKNPMYLKIPSHILRTAL